MNKSTQNSGVSKPGSEAFPRVVPQDSSDWEFADGQLCMAHAVSNNQLIFECSDHYLSHEDRIYEFGLQAKDSGSVAKR